MAKTTLTIKVTNSLEGQLREELNKKIGKVAREAVVALHPSVNRAVDEAIERQKSDFIPTDSEAHELGIGEDGSIDRTKTEGAYKGMLTGANNGVTETSTRATPGTGLGRIGTIKAQVHMSVLFKTELAKVLLTNTKEGQSPDEVSWMEWLLDGATISGHRFNPAIEKGNISRTGAGIMDKGGLWQFSPARPGARESLDDAMLQKISEVAEREIQKSIKGL